MTFYAQHGYGKSTKLDDLADVGALGGVILSPADEGSAALVETARAMARRNVPTLLDPQTYAYTIPNAVARCHDESGLAFGTLNWASITPADIETQVEAVLAANATVGTTGPIIAPAPLQGTFTDLWLPLSLQYARTTSARAGGRAVLASLVVEEAALGGWPAIERWLDVATTLDVVGFYVIIARRHPYPAAWDRLALANLLRMVFRLQVLNDYHVFVGYADVGGLAAIAIGAEAMATGWNYRQRHFQVERWVPSNGGQPANPRLTSGILLSAMLAQGEVDAAARSVLGAQIVPDVALRDRMVNRPASWTNAMAVVQHMEVLSRLVTEVEGAGGVGDRLDHLAAMTARARQTLIDLAKNGVAVGSSYATAIANLAAGADDARRAEGI